MKIRVILLPCLLSGLVALNAWGDGATNSVAQLPADVVHTTEQNSAIKEFKFEDIGLGATFAEVKTKCPDLEFQKDKSEPKVKLAVWRNFSPKTADVVTYCFFNGKLYEIEAMYESKTLDKIGGYQTIYEKLLAKYGKEDENSPDDKYLCYYEWQFYDADRYINYRVNSANSCGYLTVADKEQSRQLKEARKASADVGF